MPLLERLDGARETSPRNHPCHQAGVPRLESRHLESRFASYGRTVLSALSAPKLSAFGHRVQRVGTSLCSMTSSRRLVSVTCMVNMIGSRLACFSCVVWEAFDIRVSAVKSSVSRSRREFSGNCESRAPVQVSDLGVEKRVGHRSQRVSRY
jgi:hypothetical protein